MRKVISTSKAPTAIGTYSQAVVVDKTVYISGQIGINPADSRMEKDFTSQLKRVFENLKVIAAEAGGDLNKAVKVNIFLTDLANFAEVNNVMATYFDKPYPARAAVQVAKLPKDALVEIDAILHL
jgi:reactive intermediate/imine deaminase